jgi:amidase
MAVAPELCTQTLTEVAELIQKREVSPVEITEAMLARISSLDETLHSFITVTADLALQQARAAEREITHGNYRGSLHGVPIAVKDLVYTKAIRTTCGSKVLADWVPEYDATVIEKLYAAGAILVGKLSMTEFAGIGYHPTVPPPVNPWHPDRWPGASSSGSGVATAASLCFGSIGSDTGGSIRFPSSACGVVGLKPTYGKVSRYGVFPLAESLDHAGPITRSVADAAVLLRTIAGFDSSDPTTRREAVPNYWQTLFQGVKNLRIGVDEDYCTSGVDPEISEAVLTATRVLSDLGASVRGVKLSLIDEAVGAWGVIFTAEGVAAHEPHYSSWANDYSPAFRQFQENGAKVRGVDYAKAYATRQAVSRRLDDLFQEVDLLLCPTMAIAPPTLKDFPPDGLIPPEQATVLLRYTAPFNLTGHPAMSIPCGFNREGLPMGLQIIGRLGEEGTVMQAGYAYQQATAWHKQRPPDLSVVRGQ